MANAHSSHNASSAPQIHRRSELEARLVQISPSENRSTGIIGTKNYLVSLENECGEIKSPKQNWTLEVRNGAHDVVDLLPYAIVGEAPNQQIYVAVTDSFRPATLLGLEPKLQNQNYSREPFLTGQPGSYVELKPGQSNASLRDTASEILRSKLGILTSKNVQILPASNFPNPKDSSEFVTQLIAEVALPTELEYTLPGKGHAAGRRVRFLPIEGVIEAYLKDEIKDPRLIQSCLALADRLHITMPVPTQDLSKAAIFSQKVDIPVLSSVQAAISFCRKGPSINKETLHIRMEENNEQHCPHFNVVNGVALIRAAGKPEYQEQEVKFNALLQQDLRYNNCLCYTKRSDGKIYVLVNKGLRPALTLRSTSTHPIGTELPEWSIEGISFPASNTFVNDSKDVTTAKLKLKGITADNIQVLSSTEYPSPGFSPNCLSRSLVYFSELDTNILQNLGSAQLLPTEYALVELGALISAANVGEVHDLNLITSARLLQASLGYERNRLNLWTAAEREAFSEIATRGSTLLNLITSSPEGLRIHAMLYTNPLYRKLLQFGESSLGIVPREFKHFEEQIFFDAGLAIFALPEIKNGAAFVIQLLHDLRHYAIGSMVPFHCDQNRKIIFDSNGQPRAQSQEEYDTAYRENEAEAGFFSHYDLPKLLGLEDSNVVLGFQPLSKVFDALGLKDRASALKAFRQIELERRIPSEILNHEAYQQPEIRDAIIQLLKLARIFDCHMQQLYPHWLQYPKVAQTALDFSETIVSSLNDHLNAFEGSLRRTLAAPEGFNPFKTYISQFINSEIRMRAMRLAYISELLQEKKPSFPINDSSQEPFAAVLTAIDQHLSILFTEYKKLSVARTNCNSLDYTIENLASLRAIKAFNNTEAKKCDQLYEEALSLLPEDLRESLIGRELPFFPRLEFGKDPSILAYAEACEKLSKAPLPKD